MSAAELQCQRHNSFEAQARQEAVGIRRSYCRRMYEHEVRQRESSCGADPRLRANQNFLGVRLLLW